VNSPGYAEIAHLVQGVDAQAGEVHIHFLSDCGKFEQTVTVPRARVAQQAQQSIPPRKALLSWVKAALRRVLRESTCAPDPLSQAELEEVTMRAFAQVASNLSLVDNRWVGLLRSEHPGEFFERQLSAAPITEKYDQEVLVRVLLEVSRSDSNCRVEERAFLQEVVKDEALIARLQKAPRITVAELAEVSTVQVKQTLLMLAWAMAYADGSLDPEEMAHLTHLCRGFMLPEQRVRELQLAAKLSLLDRYLDAQRGKMSLEELRDKFDNKARGWGVCERNLCKLRAWYPGDFPADSEQSQPLSADDDD
jgi:tellurite resistance protein